MIQNLENSSQSDRAPSSHHAAAAAVVVVAVLLVFGRSIAFDFVLWDDDINIHTNEHIRALTAENIRWMLADFTYALRYQPLSWLGWALDHHFWGMDPLGYHLSNLGLHAASAGMAYFAMLKIARDGLGLRAASRGHVILIALAALFWAIHPLRAEVVSWVTGRRYSQVMFFLLLSFLLDPGVVRDGPLDRRARTRLGLAFVAFAASLFTYPIALEWPLILLMLDRASCRDDGTRRAFPWKLWAIRRAPWFALSAVLTMANVAGRYFIPGRWEAAKTLDEFSVTARVMQAAYSLAIYPLEIALPWKLSPYYPRLHNLDRSDPVLIAATAFVLLLTLSLVILASRVKWPLACWAAYCAMMFTKLGWTETPHFASDRYVHVASFATSVALLAMAWPIICRLRRPARAHALLAFIVALYALAAFRQGGIWRDSETLLTTMSRRLGPDPFQSAILWRLGEVRRVTGNLTVALEAYSGALDAVPHSTRARYSRAMVLADLGRSAEAIPEFRRVLAARDEPWIRMQLATLLLKVASTEEALKELRAVAAAHPADLSSRMTIGQIHESRFEHREALAMFEQCAQIAPDDADVRAAVERVRAKMGAAP